MAGGTGSLPRIRSLDPYFFPREKPRLVTLPSPPCVETNFKVGPIPSSRGNPLGNRADRSSKSGWRRYVTDGARARAWSREILRVTSIETERNDGWRRYALSLVKNDIALVREQWKSGKCNWNERNDEFRIEFYDLSAIGNLCGKIGARKLEEQGKKFSGGSVQQVWTHSTREERGQVCEFREEFDPRGRIAGPLYQDPSKG